MKQRVVIAMALACSPKLLLADEPTTALDVTIQAQVLAMIRDLKKRLNTSLLLISHDLGVVAKVCDTVAIMYGRRDRRVRRPRRRVRAAAAPLQPRDSSARYRAWT